MQEKAELIIVRRRSAFDSGEEKNSVWKIAYADFMTAMMAFFLVMWLISATNQETRESVATYFNPIKLADSTPDRKGMSDARRVDPGKAEEGDSKRPLPEPGKAAQSTSGRRRRNRALTKPRCSATPMRCCRKLPVLRRASRRLGASLDPTRKEGMKGGEAYQGSV